MSVNKPTAREREILRRLYGEKLQRSSMKRAPNPPYDKWLNVSGSPVKKIRFRKSGNVDVVIVPRRRNESYRKVKKQVRKLQQSGALEPGPMFQKFRKAQKISKTGRKRNAIPWNLRYSAHQLPSKEWEIIDRSTGRVVQTVKTKSAAIQAVTKWNHREGLSGAWRMRGNPVSAEYTRALEKFRRASARYRDVQTMYRERKINDDAFLRERKLFDNAQEEMDVAERKEIARGSKNPFVSSPTTFHTKFGKYQLLPKRVHTDGTVDFLYSERGIGQDFSVGPQGGINGPLPKYAHGNAKKLAKIAREQY